MANVLIMGCGDLGTATGQQLTAAGHTVWGLRRRPERIPAPIHPLAGDFATPDGLPPLPADLDTVYFIATPGEFTDRAYQRAYVDGLRNTLAALEREGQRPRRIIFTSSTSVYGTDDGRWVDETSPTEPTRFSGQRLCEAEGLLNQSGFPGVVLRFGGIYGPGREYHLRKVREGIRGQHEPPVWTNRIHRDDCVGLLAHLFGLESPEPLYLGVDDTPALRHELLAWLAQQMELDPPGDPPMPPGEVCGKRCHNGRLQASGYRLRYPDYRTGYRAVLGQHPAYARG